MELSRPKSGKVSSRNRRQDRERLTAKSADEVESSKSDEEKDSYSDDFEENGDTQLFSRTLPTPQDRAEEEGLVLHTKRTWRPLSASNIKVDKKEHLRRKHFHKGHLANKQGPFVLGTTPISRDKSPGFEPYLRYGKEPAKLVCHTHGDVKTEDVGMQCALGPSLQPCPGYHIPDSMRKQLNRLLRSLDEVKGQLEERATRPAPALKSPALPVELLAELTRMKSLIPDVMRVLENEQLRNREFSSELSKYSHDVTLLRQLQQSLDNLTPSLTRALDSKLEKSSSDLIHAFDQGMARSFATFESHIKPQLERNVEVQCPTDNFPADFVAIVTQLRQHSADLAATLDQYKQQLQTLNHQTTQLVDLQQNMATQIIPKIDGVQKTLDTELGHAPPHRAAGGPDYGPEIKDIDLGMKELKETVDNLRLEVNRVVPVEQPAVSAVQQDEVFPCRCSCKAEISLDYLWDGRGETSLYMGACDNCNFIQAAVNLMEELRIEPTSDREWMARLGFLINSCRNDHLLTNIVDFLRDLHAGFKRSYDFQICIEGLLDMALMYNSHKAAETLVEFLSASEIVNRTSIGKGSRSPDRHLLIYAARSRCTNAIEKLLHRMTYGQRVDFINQAFKYDLPLFETARQGNVEMFETLARHGAELDAKEDGSTILHHLVELSAGKARLPDLFEGHHKDEDNVDMWQKTIAKMMQVVYENCGRWWITESGLHEPGNNSDNTGTFMSNIDLRATVSEQSAKECAMRYLLKATNKENVTPLELAADIGSPEVMTFFMSHPPYRLVMTPEAYGTLSTDCLAYVTDQIDSRLNRWGHSVLERLVLRRPEEEAAAILRLEPFNTMISERWRVYKHAYRVLLLLYALFVFVYTVCSLERVLEARSLPEMYRPPWGTLLLFCEILTILVMVGYLVGEVLDIYYCGRFELPDPRDRSGFYRICKVMFILMAFVYYGLHYTMNPDQDVALAVSLVFGWISTLPFWMTFKRFASFPTMVHRLGVTHVPMFLATLLTLWIAFSTAMFVAFQGAPTNNEDFRNDTFWVTGYSMFKLSVGLLHADHVAASRRPDLGLTVFIFFIVIVVIVVMNIFIAMLSANYLREMGSVELTWQYWISKYVLLLEHRFIRPLYCCFTGAYSDGADLKRLDGNVKYFRRLVRLIDRKGSIREKQEHAVLMWRPISKAIVSRKAKGKVASSIASDVTDANTLSMRVVEGLEIRPEETPDGHTAARY